MLDFGESLTDVFDMDFANWADAAEQLNSESGWSLRLCPMVLHAAKGESLQRFVALVRGEGVNGSRESTALEDKRLWWLRRGVATAAEAIV